MKKKLNIPKDFWKDFKDRKDFDEFFGELFQEGINQMLKGEMTDHLGYEKNSKDGDNSGNSRNGDYPKTLKTNLGEIAEVIIGLYSRGMSTADIQEQIDQIYGVQVDSSSVSNITNTLLESIKEWQSRPLEEVYFVVWMDGISIKIRHNGKVVNKTIYLVIGLTQEGMKQVLGMWISETESASFWMTVLTDLKACGVKDILIASTDNLNGFTDSIKGVFPDTVTQICVVHQVRNSLRYVVWKEKKEFAADMKEIYHAAMKSVYLAISNIERKWIMPIRNWGMILQQFLIKFETKAY